MKKFEEMEDGEQPQFRCETCGEFRKHIVCDDPPLCSYCGGAFPTCVFCDRPIEEGSPDGCWSCQEWYCSPECAKDHDRRSPECEGSWNSEQTYVHDYDDDDCEDDDEEEDEDDDYYDDEEDDGYYDEN